MDYAVRSEKRPNTMGLDDTIVILRNTVTGAAAEVWPALGFNCIHWQWPWEKQQLNLLYADAQLLTGGRASRSGIPILFPFPNRVRGGRFTWQGKEYQLPLNDPTKTNAIHGFACWRPWRVVDQGADPAGAWVTGEFRPSIDAPETLDLWPADYQLRITDRLTRRGLRIEATVTNPDRSPLPFGLGYHPYFRIPFASGGEQDYWVDCSAREYWELQDSLPTGELKPAAGPLDLSAGQWFAGLKLDDVLTTFPKNPRTVIDGLNRRARLRHASSGIGLQVWTSPSFRELVVFTPVHRHAVCLEPYTCTTDAVNLEQRGVDAGWLVLQPGEEWKGVVELVAPGVAS